MDACRAVGAVLPLRLYRGVPARANPSLNLKVLPHLADKFPLRAAGLGMTASSLLAALIWNDHARPARELEALDAPVRLKRIPLGISLRAPARRIALRRARTRKLSLNAYLEALMAAHMARPSAPFLILFSERKSP